jgi:large conductance mechanosensitive channel
VTLNYGQFIQDVVDFLIIAFCIFLMIKGIAKLSRKKEEEDAAAPAPEPEPSAEEKLLTEIRDLLKNK